MPPPSDAALPAVQVERDPDADAPDLGIVAEQASAARSKPEGAETLATEPVDEAPRDERQVAARPAPSAEVAVLSDASPEHPPEAGGGASAMAPDGVEASDPAAIIPDLGIIAAGGPAWLLQPALVTTGSPQVRAIFERGQELGNDPHAFSKIGDCNSEPPFFLARFDGSGYDLGPYAGLQFVVDHFAGSFARASMAAWTGNHAWAVFEPLWANPSQCLAGETPIACEFRVQRPSVALIALGTNEVGSSALFEENLRAIVEYSIEQGVIPVLGTKADQLEGSDLHNEIIRALAEEYGIPLWDFGRAAEMLPGRGLQADGFHLTYVEPYYTQPAALQSGHAVHNLTALMALDAVWRSVIREQP